MHGPRVLLLAILAMLPLLVGGAEPPRDLGAKDAATPGAPNYANAAVTLPDGSLQSYFRRGLDQQIAIFAIRSTDDGRSWSEPTPLVRLDDTGWGGPLPLLDQQGELHFFVPRVRGEGRSPNVDRFIDLYHLRSTGGRQQFTQPQRIYEGYVGSLNGVNQLPNGRIVVPFGHWVPHRPVAPPTGANVTTCVYSDDLGESWHRSPAELTAPCRPGYNGNNYGACEPTLVPLRDGRVWMLMRTQDEWLYESFSGDGVDWTPARRSRFHSSDSPAFPVRLPDGRLVVFWNNCQKVDRVGKDGVYSGRDALHAAISADDGKTWRGFREVYRDATRHESPPKSGDRGTGYPHATVARDGRILLVAGQGADRRRRFLIDPEWLLETSQSDDFQSLDAWHLFKSFGTPSRFWRDRVQGPQQVVHPDFPQRKVLHIRRPDERAPDGAAWNFPAGQRGELTVRLRPVAGHHGLHIGLTDRMFEPCDPAAASGMVFSWSLSQQDRLPPDIWRAVEFHWNVTAGECLVSVDGGSPERLPILQPAPNGLCYLLIQSMASEVDQAGVMFESVEVTVEAN